MVKRVQSLDLLHDVVKVLLQFALVKHFDGNLDVRVKAILCLEDATECASSQNLRVLVNDVVFLQLSDALLLECGACLQFLLFLLVLRRWLFKCG